MKKYTIILTITILMISLTLVANHHFDNIPTSISLFSNGYTIPKPSNKNVSFTIVLSNPDIVSITKNTDGSFALKAKTPGSTQLTFTRKEIKSTQIPNNKTETNTQVFKKTITVTVE